MNDEVKLILTKLKIVSEEKENGAYICDREHSKLLLSYIEQLEKENDRLKKDYAIVINNNCDYITLEKKIEQLEKRNKQLYEGFMATQEELTDYAIKNEQLEADYKEANDSITWWTNRFNAVERDNRDYKSRIDKAIEYFKFENPEIFENPKYTNHLWTIDGLTIKRFIDILKGDSDE